MKISELFTIICLVLPFTISAQEQITSDSLETISRKVKHFSIGAKAGTPIGIGGSAEIVLPILGNHVAPYIDLSSLNDLTLEDVSIDHNYLEYGLNIYFGQEGRGLYLGIGASSTTTDFAYSDEVSDSGNTYIGVATTSLDINMINAKLGFKTGGTIFFRIELGYGFGDIPQELTITGTTEVMGMTQTETSVEEIPEVPGWSEDGMFLGSISLGLSF